MKDHIIAALIGLLIGSWMPLVAKDYSQPDEYNGNKTCNITRMSKMFRVIDGHIGLRVYCEKQERDQDNYYYNTVNWISKEQLDTYTSGWCSIYSSDCTKPMVNPYEKWDRETERKRREAAALQQESKDALELPKQ